MKRIVTTVPDNLFSEDSCLNGKSTLNLDWLAFNVIHQKLQYLFKNYGNFLLYLLLNCPKAFVRLRLFAFFRQIKR